MTWVFYQSLLLTTARKQVWEKKLPFWISVAKLPLFIYIWKWWWRLIFCTLILFWIKSNCVKDTFSQANWNRNLFKFCTTLWVILFFLCHLNGIKRFLPCVKNQKCLSQLVWELKVLCFNFPLSFFMLYVFVLNRRLQSNYIFLTWSSNRVFFLKNNLMIQMLLTVQGDSV